MMIILVIFDDMGGNWNNIEDAKFIPTFTTSSFLIS